VGVKDTSTAFLQYLQQLNIRLGAKLKVQAKIEFDGSMNLIIDKDTSVSVSKKFIESVLVS
jgi:DtxR family Mn-dependent transcriptional regulator